VSTRSEQSKEPPQSWTAARKRAVVLEYLKGQDTMAGVAHRHRLPVQTILGWREQFLREGVAPTPVAERRESLRMQGIQPMQSRFSGLA
jgi:transposase-like protein